MYDTVAKRLTGAFFRGLDQRTSGPMELRFKRSVASAIRNLVVKERTRRHYLPTIPIGQRIEKAMADEAETVGKRRAPMAMRRAVGA